MVALHCIIPIQTWVQSIVADIFTDLIYIFLIAMRHSANATGSLI